MSLLIAPSRFLLVLLLSALPVLAWGESSESPSETDEGARSEQAVAMCEASAWGRAYRAGCVDMCTMTAMGPLEEAGVDAQAAFAEARARCGEHCYDFCTRQVERLERARAGEPPATPPSEPTDSSE